MHVFSPIKKFTKLKMVKKCTVLTMKKSCKFFKTKIMIILIKIQTSQFKVFLDYYYYSLMK
jgi:hypothetical protein